MTKWLRHLFEGRARRVHSGTLLDEEQMRVAVARARAHLQAEGRLEVELEAQREIRERVRTAA